MARRRRHTGSLALVACVAGLVLAPSAPASEIISPTGDPVSAGTTDIDHAGQTFTVPSTPGDDFLYRFRIPVITRNQGGSFKIFIVPASGGTPDVAPSGPYLFESEEITKPCCFFPLELYPNVPVTPGAEYAWFTQVTRDDPEIGATDDGYAEGNAVFWEPAITTWHPFPEVDFGFQAFFNSGQAITETEVSCAVQSTPVDTPFSCDAQVNTAGSAVADPTGSVNFRSSVDSETPTCTLDPTTGSCTASVQFTPTTTGGRSIVGEYQGDANNQASANNTGIDVVKRATGSAVDCSPATVVIDQASTCTVTLSDLDPPNKSTPTGAVDFSHTGTGNLGASSCTLSGGTCSTTYTPTAQGGSSITTNYSGDEKHNGSSTNDGVTANKRTSGLNLSCVPATPAADQTSTCTATVSDTSVAGTSSTPTGVVNFSRTGTGNLSSGGCALTAGACSVTYTPTAAGSNQVSAFYFGDAKHDTSVGTDPVDAVKRTTAVALDCAPAAATTGQASTCTATVADTHGAGTASAPTGTVDFTRTGAGDLSAQSCTLTGGACSVSYTPTAAGTSTVTADYGGSAKHEASTTNDAVDAADPPVVPPADPPAAPLPSLPSADDSAAASREDPKCERLRRKLGRQKRNLAKADTAGKRSQVQRNIDDTKRRMARLGC